MSASAARVLTAATALALFSLSACGGGSTTTTDEVAYTIDQPITALVIGARAAAIEIGTGTGPATVKETHRYAKDKPGTAHQVQDGTLRLTESGCADDNVRCEVKYHITVPAATSAEITAQAGAVRVNGLSGDVHITTEAGAVEGTALSGGEVIVKTQAGAATLKLAKAPAMLRTETQVGAVELQVPGGNAYAIAVHTDVGKADVSVRNDPASAHRIEVSTQVGTVRIEPLP
jgi:hypothetical protein